MFSIVRRFAAPLVALVALTGCHDSTAPENSGPLWVLERPVTTTHDTVDTELPGTLHIAVYDSTGKPRPRTGVWLRAAHMNAAVPGVALYAQFLAADNWQALTETFPIWFTTDSVGELRVPLKLGSIVGQVGVTVAIIGQEATSSYTVSFDVHPGAPARVRLLPGDTAVYVDRSYQLRARVADRYGNAREEPATVVGDSSAATSTGAAVTGHRFGRARFRATWNAFADTAWASVVPHGTLAVRTPEPSHVAFVNLDGSEFRVTPTSRRVGYISWAPSGTRMTVQDEGGATPYCYYEGFAAVVDTTGSERQLLSVGDCSNFMEAQRTPRFSHDELWVYFERARYASGAGSFGSTIYRIHPDGTGLEPVIAPGATEPLGGMYPAPSPSGRYLAYRVYTQYPATELRVIDWSTGQTASTAGIDVALWMPHADTLVAMRSWPSGTVVLLRADGSEVRSVPYASDWSGALLYDVSPDGKWIVIQRNGLEIVSLETGLRLPLGFTVGTMGTPAWRPE